MERKLGLPEDRIARARELSQRIVQPVLDFIETHTTVTVERATLRLAGADGADADGVPVPNLVVDQLKEKLVSITNTVEKAMTAKDKAAKAVETITEKVTGFFGSVGKFFSDLFNK